MSLIILKFNWLKIQKEATLRVCLKQKPCFFDTFNCRNIIIRLIRPDKVSQQFSQTHQKEIVGEFLFHHFQKHTVYNKGLHECQRILHLKQYPFRNRKWESFFFFKFHVFGFEIWVYERKKKLIQSKCGGSGVSSEDHLQMVKYEILTKFGVYK